MDWTKDWWVLWEWMIEVVNQWGGFADAPHE